MIQKKFLSYSTVYVIEHNIYEPYITANSNKQHYEGHLLKYYDNLQRLLKDASHLKNHNIDDIILKSYGVLELIDIYNNASQIYSHIMFWESLTKQKIELSVVAKKKIISKYTSFQNFVEEIISRGSSFFGSGWLWVIVMQDESIEIITTSNSFNPLNIDSVKDVVICIDLWEHAYYLDYKHERKTYLTNLCNNIVNWGLLNSVL